MNLHCSYSTKASLKLNYCESISLSYCLYVSQYMSCLVVGLEFDKKWIKLHLYIAKVHFDPIIGLN